MNPRQGLEWTLDIQDKILKLLARTISSDDADPELQVHLLSVLRAIIAIQGSSSSHPHAHPHAPSPPSAERADPHHPDRPHVWSHPSFISTIASGLTQAWMPAIDADIRVPSIFPLQASFQIVLIITQMQSKNPAMWDGSWFVGHYWVEMLRVCMRYLKSGDLSKMLVPTLSALAALLKLIPPEAVHEPLPFQTASTLLQSIQALLQCTRARVALVKHRASHAQTV